MDFWDGNNYCRLPNVRYDTLSDRGIIYRRKRLCEQWGKIPQYPAGKKIWSLSFSDIYITESILNVLCMDYILAGYSNHQII